MTKGESIQNIEMKFMHPFATPEVVQSALDGLASRELVGVLARRAGQKERRWEQLLTKPDAGDSVDALGVDVSVDAVEVSESATSNATASLPKRRMQGGHHDVSHGLAARTMEVRNPATGAVLRSVEVADDADIEAKLKRARAAQR